MVTTLNSASSVRAPRGARYAAMALGVAYLLEMALVVMGRFQSSGMALTALDVAALLLVGYLGANSASIWAMAAIAGQAVALACLILPGQERPVALASWAAAHFTTLVALAPLAVISLADRLGYRRRR